MRMPRPSFKSEISLGAVLQICIILFAVVAGWFKYANGVDNNTKAIEANNGFITTVQTEYKAANVQMTGRHATQFERVDTRFDRMADEVEAVKDDTSALAVSLGKLEAGQSFMQNSLEQLLEKANE